MKSLLQRLRLIAHYELNLVNRFKRNTQLSKFLFNLLKPIHLIESNDYRIGSKAEPAAHTLPLGKPSR